MTVHFRTVKADDVSRVEHIVDSVLAQHTLLHKTRGKKFFELRPNMPWGEGKAVLWLLDAMGLNAKKPQPTCADYRLSGRGEVYAFLNALTAMLGEGT